MINDKMVRLLANVMGLVNQRLLLQNEYPIAENRFSGLSCGSVCD